MRWGTSLSHVFRPFGAYVFMATGAPTWGSAPGYDVSPLWGDRPPTPRRGTGWQLRAKPWIGKVGPIFATS